MQCFSGGKNFSLRRQRFHAVETKDRITTLDVAVDLWRNVADQCEGGAWIYNF